MRNLVRKVVRKIYYIYLLKKGYRPYMVNFYGSHVIESLFDNPDNLPLKQRLWALKRGFWPSRIKWYGLTEENYRDYINDRDYYRIYPLNNGFSMWIDDKLTMKYVLSKYNNYMPEYYCKTDENCNIIPLMDFPNDFEKSIDGLISLLVNKKIIAVKKLDGYVGMGFYKLRYDSSADLFYANDDSFHIYEFEQFIFTLKGYLFTEFVLQNDYFEKIYPMSAHTIRVQTVKYDNNPAECIYSFIRIGSDKTKHCVSAIGDSITAVVNVDDGMIEHGFYMDDNKEWVTCTVHPDTGESFVGRIPEWDFIVSKCLEMHEYMNELEYLGFDVIITNQGFKICEINSHSGIGAMQYDWPMMKDERCFRYFSRYIKG